MNSKNPKLDDNGLKLRQRNKIPSERAALPQLPTFTPPNKPGIISPKPVKRPKFVEKNTESSPPSSRNPTQNSKRPAEFGSPLEELHADEIPLSIGLQDFVIEQIRDVKRPKLVDNLNRSNDHQLGAAEHSSSSTISSVIETFNGAESSINSKDPTEHEEELYISQSPRNEEPSQIDDLSMGLNTIISPTRILLPSPNSDPVTAPEKATYWHGSQQELINYLRGKHNIEATTLADYLEIHGALRSIKDDAARSRIQLSTSQYVVALRTRSTEISEMPKSHHALCSPDGSIESFLVRVWNTVNHRFEPSILNSEMYTGPWSDITTALGRQWVVYIWLHFHIFNLVDQKPGHWIQLAGFVKHNSERFRSKSPVSPQDFISKADIMYQRRDPSRALMFEPLEPEIYSAFPTDLRKLVAITENKIQRKAYVKPRSVNKGKGWTPQKDVATFLARTLRSILPISLIGSESNKRALYKNVLRFLKTPGFSKTSIKSLSKGIRVSEIPWLRNVEEKTQILHKCLIWLYNAIIKKLLVHHFYLTEMSGKLNSLYYFEQNIWKYKFELPLSRKLYRQGTAAETASATASTSETPNAVTGSQETRGEPWRVVPKSDGSSRPIINLKEFNSGLRMAHLVLQQSSNLGPARLHSWHSWITKLYEYKQRMTAQEGKPPKYHIVKVDISGCYDNANLSKVKELVQNVLEEGRNVFRVQPFSRWRVRDGLYRPCEWAMKLADDDAAWREDARDTYIVAPSSRPVLVQGDEILQNIHGLLDDLRIRFGHDKSVPFKNGIPQGSACSLDLCDILLDDLTSTKLAKFGLNEDSLLMRYVDDFLFITTHEYLAQEFCSMMSVGFKAEYGVECNPAKIVTTLGAPVNEIQFLGIKFDTKTLEVNPNLVPTRFDFTNSSSATLLKKQLTVDLQNLLNPLRAFKREGKALPPSLVNSSLMVFGKALVDRLAAFTKFKKQPEHQVFAWILRRYILNLFPASERGRVSAIIRRSFQNELQKRLAAL